MGIIIFTQLMRDLVISLDQLIVYLLPSASLGSQSYGTDKRPGYIFAGTVNSARPDSSKCTLKHKLVYTKARKQNVFKTLLDKTFLEILTQLCLGTFLFYSLSAAFIHVFMLLWELWYSVPHSFPSETQPPLNSLIPMPGMSFWFGTLTLHCQPQRLEALLLIM